MLLFRKLVDETQISKPQEYTDTFRQILTSIFLSVRAILKETVQYETPCTLNKERCYKIIYLEKILTQRLNNF